MKVGNLETKFEEEFGLKVQVSGSDDSYLCKNDLTLNAAQQEDEKKLGRKARKAERSDSASDESSEDQSSVADQPVDGEDDLDFELIFLGGMNLNLVTRIISIRTRSSSSLSMRRDSMS